MHSRRDESKLPVWAREELQRARRERDEAREALRMRDTPGGRIAYYTHEGTERVAHPLPSEHVEFNLDGGNDWQTRVDVYMREGYLEVYTRRGYLAVYPVSGNVVQLRMEEKL